MTEKVCRCEPAENATLDKNDGSKAKEKLRLFSRKKSNSLNKNACSKCGLPFASNDSSINATVTSRNVSDIQNQNVTQLRTPPPKSAEENAVVHGAIVKEGKKTCRRQSEELPQIPVKASEYLYQNPANGSGGERGVGGGDNIYTEIEEKPEKKLVSSAHGESLVPANRRRPTSSVGGPPVRGQTPGGQISNGGYLNNCDCPKCRSQRGQDLTVELLPMDTQVTLQSMMQGATLMCNLL